MDDPAPGRRRPCSRPAGPTPGGDADRPAPVAWTIGDDFRPAPRRPAREITGFDQWGYTTQRPISGPVTLADGPGVTVEVDVKASPADVWPYISDIELPARFSEEFQGAEWISETPGLGATFVGRNHRDDMGDWEVTCHIVGYEENLALIHI